MANCAEEGREAINSSNFLSRFRACSVVGSGIWGSFVVYNGMVRRGIKMLVIGIESDLKIQVHEQASWRN